MKTIDKTKVKGFLEVYESNDNINFNKIHEQENLFTDECYRNLLDLVVGNSTGYILEHFAIGDNSSNVSKTDTLLLGEYDRFEIDSKTISESGGYHWLEMEMNLNNSEGNGTIKKLGLIAINSATTLLNYDKDNPDKSGAEWRLTNAVDILLPNGKVKDNTITLKFIWKWRLG